MKKGGPLKLCEGRLIVVISETSSCIRRGGGRGLSLIRSKKERYSICLREQGVSHGNTSTDANFKLATQSVHHNAAPFGDYDQVFKLFT